MTGTALGDIVRCGATDPDPVVEAKVAVARQAIGAHAGLEGCAQIVRLRQAYRCTECGRFMHRACLLAHFASHATAHRVSTPPRPECR